MFVIFIKFITYIKKISIRIFSIFNNFVVDESQELSKTHRTNYIDGVSDSIQDKFSKNNSFEQLDKNINSPKESPALVAPISFLSGILEKNHY